METPLSPLEFARRARRLYGDREAVVDGELRLTYEQFLSRCDRWSARLQALGVGRGDRVAYIAANTHAQLESFYAVPQLGAVLVPINYRLTAADFNYIVNHSGATVLCVQAEYQEAVDGIRAGVTGVEADALAREPIAEAGYGEKFGHGLGHGVGLLVHEAPRLSTESPETLEPGNVVTIEPGIYLPGLGGVRIEDLAVVTEDGLDVLTTVPKELRVVQ